MGFEVFGGRFEVSGVRHQIVKVKYERVSGETKLYLGLILAFTRIFWGYGSEYLCDIVASHSFTFGNSIELVSTAVDQQSCKWYKCVTQEYRVRGP